MTNKILEERKPGRAAIKDGLDAIVELFMVCHAIGVQLHIHSQNDATTYVNGAIVQVYESLYAR